jgi:hypothetical protein
MYTSGIIQSNTLCNCGDFKTKTLTSRSLKKILFLKSGWENNILRGQLTNNKTLPEAHWKILRPSVVVEDRAQEGKPLIRVHLLEPLSTFCNYPILLSVEFRDVNNVPKYIISTAEGNKSFDLWRICSPFLSLPDWHPPKTL